MKNEGQHLDPASVGVSSLLRPAQAAPWKLSFITVLRRIAAIRSQVLPQPRIGLANRPQQEPFRLGQTAALSFAPREIAEVFLPEPRTSPAGAGHPGRLPTVRLYGLGLLGPNGPLPLHYTELVRERSQNFNDSTLADFLDVFHHRYLTHMYRAWAQAQAAAGLDRAADETFSAYVARLIGHDPLEIQDSVLPVHARLAASAHLSREARNPDGLAQSLARFFSIPVQVQEFVMHWIRIDDADQSHLGRPRVSSMLGIGAMAGEVVADRQSKFRLVLGPLPLHQYLRLTPHGQDLPLLIEWVRGFIGFEFVWEVELRVCHVSAPPSRLGDAEKLGWSTWLGDASAAATPGKSIQAGTLQASAAPALDYAVGMVFEPELYASQQSSPSRSA